jgi:hypothetical protein
MGSTGDPGGASSLALYGPVTSGQASPSLRRQQAAPWGGAGPPAASALRTGHATWPGPASATGVLHSTPEYQPYPRPAALAGQPVPAADLG